MENVAYTFHKDLPGQPFDEAVDAVTAALKEEGFGVLTTIDVKATLKQKIDADFRQYVILGACNPHLAHRVLGIDDNLGVLLPCNVVVAETEEGAEVSIARPEAMLDIAGTDRVSAVAAEAEQRLARVLAAL